VPVLRVKADGAPYVTDNGNEILDLKGLRIADPRALEADINSWPGVVTVGLFAQRGADLCLLGTPEGVETVIYPRI
jgi:ribose 5-phosphate isomerase A